MHMSMDSGRAEKERAPLVSSGAQGDTFRTSESVAIFISQECLLSWSLGVARPSRASWLLWLVTLSLLA